MKQWSFCSLECSSVLRADLKYTLKVHTYTSVGMVYTNTYLNRAEKEKHEAKTKLYLPVRSFRERIRGVWGLVAEALHAFFPHCRQSNLLLAWIQVGWTNMQVQVQARMLVSGWEYVLEYRSGRRRSDDACWSTGRCRVCRSKFL